jgi:predicted Holliday junction resolvase-like endonuclease
MDADDKTKIDEAFSEIEARAQARRKRTVILTFAPVFLTAVIVLVLAREVAHKRADLQQIEAKARDLEQKVREKQRERELLEDENKQLEERKRSLQRFIEGLHERRNRLPPPEAAVGKSLESVVVSREGDVPETFVPVPEVDVELRFGNKDRDVFDVALALGPEGQLGSVESVTYDLNQDWYADNHFESTEGPRFAAKFSVYECLGTVLVTVKLKSGSSTSIALDWCKNDKWPKPAQTISAPAPAPERPKGQRPGPPGGNRPPRPRPDSPTRPN